MALLTPFLTTTLGVVINPGIITRVIRRAAADHAGTDLIADAQQELHYARAYRDDTYGVSPADMWREERAQDRKAAERGWRPWCRGGWPTVTVHAVTVFDVPYGDGSVASVDVTYDTDGGKARALYGVYTDGRIALWAN